MNNLNLNKEKIEYIPMNNKQINFSLDKDKTGLIPNEDLIVYKDLDSVMIYDRVCDHAGGRLITNNKGQIKCNLHKWEFNPERGTYNSDNIKKNSLDFRKDNDNYEVKIFQKAIDLPNHKKEKKIEIEFLNHASLLVKTKDFKFATDPWLIGQAFSTGWWLKYKSPDNWIDELNSCDFLFISHNHPDHLHPETLNYVRKDMLILTPDFQSKSSESYLTSLGFNNLIKLGHQECLVDAKNEIYFSVLKSGDFRDDSGLLFKYGTFSALFNVDSNFLNYFELPVNLTLLASSFAGGAGPFPLCFENLDENQKKRGQLKTNNSLKVTRESLVSITNPKYFMPYAGFFEEKASRDQYIQKRNKKNEILDYKYLEQKYNLELIDLTHKNKHLFVGEQLISSSFINNKNIELNDEHTTEIINLFKDKNTSIEEEYIIQYFKASSFYEDFNLLILLTDDKYNQLDESILVEFSSNREPQVLFGYTKYNVIDIYESNNKNTLRLKIRKEVFINNLKNLEPWENMSIGFQVRFDRYPDTYNSKFWSHFTDNYTKFKAVRLAKECNGCELITQSLTSAIK